MNVARTVVGVIAAATVLAAFPLAAVSLAQDNHATHHAVEAAPSAGAPAKMPMPMMAHMETMAKVKAALGEAKGAAEAQGDKVAAGKIDEALTLLEQDHRAMHQHMMQMMQMMGQRMETMQGMEQDMQKMKEGMGTTEQTKPMQAKMEEMIQKMQKMHQQMKSQARECEMKCPMCQKMMAGEPKVVNTVCPIMGNKVDPYTVPDNLTREFEGKRVGFCCAACPPAWDKLSDEAKRQKLAEVMAKQGQSE